MLGATDKGIVSLAQSQAESFKMMLVMAYPTQGLLVLAVVPKHVSQAERGPALAEIELYNADTIAYFGGYHSPRWRDCGAWDDADMVRSMPKHFTHQLPGITECREKSQISVSDRYDV